MADVVTSPLFIPLRYLTLWVGKRTPEISFHPPYWVSSGTGRLGSASETPAVLAGSPVAGSSVKSVALPSCSIRKTLGLGEVTVYPRWSASQRLMSYPER